MYSPSLRYVLVLLVVLAGRGFSRATSEFVNCAFGADVTVNDDDAINGCKTNGDANVYYDCGIISSSGYAYTWCVMLWDANWNRTQGQMVIRKKPPCNLTQEDCEETACSWPFKVTVDRDKCQCKIDYSQFSSQPQLSSQCLAFCNTAYNASRADCPDCSPVSSVNKLTNVDVTKGQLQCVCNLANGSTHRKNPASCPYEQGCATDPASCGVNPGSPGVPGNDPNPNTPTGMGSDGKPSAGGFGSTSSSASNPDGSTTTTTVSTGANGGKTTTVTTTSADGKTTSTSSTDSGGGASPFPGPGNGSGGSGRDYTGILTSIDNGVQMTVGELKAIRKKMGSDSGRGSDSGGLYDDSAVVRRLDKIFKLNDSAFNSDLSPKADSGVIDTSFSDGDSSFIEQLKGFEPDSNGTPHEGILNIWDGVKSSIEAQFPESSECTPVYQWPLTLGILGTYVIDLSGFLSYAAMAVRILDYGSALAAFLLFFFGLNKVLSDLRSTQ